MNEENEPRCADPLAEHDRPWHTHNAWDNHRQTTDEAPLRDRPIMPHVAQSAGEHRGERSFDYCYVEPDSLCESPEHHGWANKEVDGS
jgi:hypothetical protein